MGERTEISWTDHTFNPWTGCTKVSPGCANCYAETMCNRFPHLGEWGPGAERKRTSEANWRKPLGWARKARRAGGRKPRVFCASLSDWLDPEVPAEWLADLLALIAKTSDALDWQLLTKRPGLWRERLDAAADARIEVNPPGAQFAERWLAGEAPEGVWLGITVEDQRRADERRRSLLEIPARVRFLSCEPLLGHLDHLCQGGIHWCIAGGESGPKARPMNPEWARALRDQCEEAGVAFHFKQWGEWSNGKRKGKKNAGRLLDGRTHDAFPFPEVQA